MLLILSAALLPLGMIALFASLESAKDNRVRRAAETRLMATASARQLSSSIARTALTLRATTTALALNDGGIEACRRTLDALVAGQVVPMRFAIFDVRGFRRCSTPLFLPPAPEMPDDMRDARVTMLPDAGAIRITLYSSDGNAIGLAELPRASVEIITRPTAASVAYDLTIRQASAEMAFHHLSRSGPLDQRISMTVPAAAGQLEVQTTIIAAPMRAIEVLMILLPLLMWLSAAAIGWIVVDRLLLKPLAQLKRAVDGYQAGDFMLALPALTTPAYEIRTLGEAFVGLTQTVARHERDLEEGLARQTKLTREVHHRVKNNLQVIASLLNLHARGARSDETRAAYASIQRRVDALAVVHRNHYAELEENKGVGLRGLIGELASNIRATASDGTSLSIALDVENAHVNQDVAVAVAFLLTELIELAMMMDKRAAVVVRLRPAEQGRALLSVESSALIAGEEMSHRLAERYGRVLEGLSRQLRSKLQIEEASGRYGIEIATLD